MNGGIDDYRIASVPSATSGVAFENLQSIGGDAAWAAVAVRGDDVFAIKRDRSLWRVQLSGGVGLQKVGGNQRWKSVDIGDGYCVALREDGTLWVAPLATQGWIYHPVFSSNFDGYAAKDSLLQLGASNAWVSAVAGVAPLAVDASGKAFWVSEYATRAVDGPEVACAKVFAPKMSSSGTSSEGRGNLPLDSCSQPSGDWQ